MGKRLDGKVIVVMGSGSVGPGWGNGKACAVAYAREGAKVVAVDLEENRAQETADIIRTEDGTALALAADATDGNSVRNALSEARSQFGRIDVVHNNVGVGATVGAPDKIDEEAWDREMRVSLKSAYLGIRYAVPVMREQGGGAITNVSSLLAVRFLRIPQVAYTVAKAGVEALTRSCATAYGRDAIRVNCIRIGFSETPLVMQGLKARGLTPEQEEREMAKSRAKVPLRGEHGEVWDVAWAGVYLASEEAKHVTGVILGIDGGLECAPL